MWAMGGCELLDSHFTGLYIFCGLHVDVDADYPWVRAMHVKIQYFAHVLKVGALVHLLDN